MAQIRPAVRPAEPGRPVIISWNRSKRASASAFVRPLIVSVIKEAEDLEIAHPWPWNAASTMRSPSILRNTVTRSPHSGLSTVTLTSGEAKRPAPVPLALFGEPSFHVAIAMCDGCDWVAAAEGCPLCGGPGPLRERP